LTSIELGDLDSIAYGDDTISSLAPRLREALFNDRAASLAHFVLPLRDIYERAALHMIAQLQ